MTTYQCEKCCYSTICKASYTKHLTSKKHNDNNERKYKCHCNKSFTTSSGLLKHKKRCIEIPHTVEDNQTLVDNNAMETKFEKRIDILEKEIDNLKEQLDKLTTTNNNLINSKVTDITNHIYCFLTDTNEISVIIKKLGIADPETYKNDTSLF